MTSSNDVKRNLCVFCASSMGTREEYRTTAAELGKAMAKAGYGLVYGGATVGLMGTVADAVLHAGGEVTGVIPQVLMKQEVAHTGVTELHVVDSMHERKALMASRSDAFVALPGGFGTLEEFCEVLTWLQLRIHNKPCLLLNVSGYYNGLLAFFDHAVVEGTLKPKNREMVLVATSVKDALAQIATAWERIEATQPLENPLGLQP
ncbi:MAG: LOG family protein [Acidobacteriaceae bacterium]